MTQLIHLQPGDRFRQPELGITGELIKINECRAYVRLDGAPAKKEFETRDGKFVEFTSPGCRFDNWSPHVNVELELTASASPQPD